MKFTDVLIRKADAVDLLDTRIQMAFANAIRDRSEIPIYYQYSQPENPALVEEKDYYIGKGKNIHLTETEDIVCDVICNMATPIVHDNFANVIDNYNVAMVKMDDSSDPVPKLAQLIIYDAGFKASVAASIQEKAKRKVVKTMPSPMVGGKPLTTHEGENPLDDPKVQKEIEKDMVETFGEEYSSAKMRY